MTVNVPFFRQVIVILGLVPITAIFWWELNCWSNNYSNIEMLFIGWSHRYTNSIINWLTVTKKNILKWQLIFPFYWLKRLIAYPSRAPVFTPRVGTCVVHPFSFLCCGFCFDCLRSVFCVQCCLVLSPVFPESLNCSILDCDFGFL